MQIQTYIYWDFSITFHRNIDKGMLLEIGKHSEKMPRDIDPEQGKV